MRERESTAREEGRNHCPQALDSVRESERGGGPAQGTTRERERGGKKNKGKRDREKGATREERERETPLNPNEDVGLWVQALSKPASASVRVEVSPNKRL